MIALRKIKREDKKSVVFLIAKKILFWLFFVAFMGLSFRVLFLSSFMEVKKVEIDFRELDKISAEDIESHIKQQIEGKYFNQVSKNNLLLISKKKISRSIDKKFIFIKSIRVDKGFPDKIKVQGEERKGIFIWQTGPSSFLADASGIVFRRIEASEDFSAEDFSRVTDLSNKEIEVGEQIGTENAASYYYLLKDKLADELELELSNNLEIPSVMSEEVQIRTLNGTLLIFNSSEKIDKQILVLKKFLEREEITSEKEQLEYVDLRIKGKVIYKIKGSEEEKPEEKSKSEDKEKDKDEKNED